MIDTNSKKGENLVDINSIAISIVTIIGFCIFGFFILFGVWKLITKSLSEDIRFKIRYGLFKRKIPDNLVELCVNAIDSGKTPEEFAKEQIIKGSYSLRNIKELIYVYKEVEKNIMEVDQIGKE